MSIPNSSIDSPWNLSIKLNLIYRYRQVFCYLASDFYDYKKSPAFKRGFTLDISAELTLSDHFKTVD